MVKGEAHIILPLLSSLLEVDTTEDSAVSKKAFDLY